jgi:hypothetical protein
MLRWLRPRVLVTALLPSATTSSVSSSSRLVTIAATIHTVRPSVHDRLAPSTCSHAAPLLAVAALAARGLHKTTPTRHIAQDAPPDDPKVRCTCPKPSPSAILRGGVTGQWVEACVRCTSKITRVVSAYRAHIPPAPNNTLPQRAAGKTLPRGHTPVRDHRVSPQDAAALVALTYPCTASLLSGQANFHGNRQAPQNPSPLDS